MTEKKGLQIWMPLALGVFLAGGILIGTRMNQHSAIRITPQNTVTTSPANYGKIEELIRYIDAKYVDDVNGGELTEKAINEILNNLDPHSVYIPSERRREIKEQLEGNLEGIGAELFVLEDTVLIVNVTEDGPSKDAGLQRGDKILRIDDQPVAGEDHKMEDIISLLRGELGTVVSLLVLREEDQVNINITRGRIPVNSVETAYMVADGLGYVKINRFSANTFKDFINALDNLVEGQTEVDLIIDLRENPGGYLQQATNILSQIFKEPEKLLVYTEGEHVNRSDYETSGRNIYNIGDVAVLIDERSASASEILAGAIQDYDRGIIIGRRSYGKGLVQEEYNLKDGSALRLTVARYYTPSGRSIQRPYNNLEQYENDLSTRYDQGEIYEEKEPALSDSIFYTEKGRAVYGENGISPDIFVPFDSIYLRQDLLQLKNHIPSFVYRYLEQNDLPVAEDLETFDRSFEIDEKIFSSFLAYAEAHGEYDGGLPDPEVKRVLEAWIKARVGFQFFREEGYYALLNKTDATVNKAIEVLQNPEPVSLLFEEK